jgi:hypothetical protein
VLTVAVAFMDVRARAISSRGANPPRRPALQREKVEAGVNSTRSGHGRWRSLLIPTQARIARLLSNAGTGGALSLAVSLYPW